MRICSISRVLATVALSVLSAAGAHAQLNQPANVPGVILGNVTAAGVSCFSFLPVEPTAKMTDMNWTGDCRDGKAQGAGTLIADYRDGSSLRFDGTMKDGLPTGPDKLMMPNKMFYDGGFQQGAFDGPSVFQTDGGGKITGDWHHGRLRQGDQKVALMVRPSTCH